MYNGQIDNTPDCAYFKAVAEFQQSRDIDADGLVGPATYKKLGGRSAAFGSAAARLLRAYATQVEVLRRLRHGCHQFVRVEYVHVNDGGQAVIANVQRQNTQD
jgi:murein L,D-transpeptidase YcbB/YkuD